MRKGSKKIHVMVRNCQEMVRKCQGLKWSKLTNKQKWGKNTFRLRPAWAPKARRLEAKKENAQPSSPFLWFNLFLCSFLFVQIFSYGQVDRLFHMGHGAIPPSLMVLFIFISYVKLGENNMMMHVCIHHHTHDSTNVIRSSWGCNN